MKYVSNLHFEIGLPNSGHLAKGEVRSNPRRVRRLLSQCPVADKTPLVDMPDLARNLGLGGLAIKDERGRMGLGSFKSLGAAFSIARAAHDRLGDRLFDGDRAKTALTGKVYTAATAGNHGLSVAAGARIFGAQAVIYIAETVPAAFESRLSSYGARVIRTGRDYEASLRAAMDAAAKNGWHLLSDTSWPGYTEPPLDVMEGYLAMAAEAADQAEATGNIPDFVFLQAGVGGLAAAVTAHFRARWGMSLNIIVVEPDAAPALQASIVAGKPVHAKGPVSNMGRLDCKEPSHLALKTLARQANGFLTVADDFVVQAILDLADAGLATSPSGGAGYAGLVALAGDPANGPGADSRVMLILSEGAGDG